MKDYNATIMKGRVLLDSDSTVIIPDYTGKPHHITCLYVICTVLYLE